MARTILIFVLGAVLGAAAGFAAGIFYYPFIFLADVVAAEKLDNAAAKPVARGSFIHADPSDSIHWGKGSVTVYSDTVRLEADFEVGPGPKYHLYLVPQKGVTPSTKVARTKFVDLGRLRAFKGSQNFPVPAGTDLSRYPTVLVWCEQFGVLITPAELKRP